MFLLIYLLILSLAFLGGIGFVLLWNRISKRMEKEAADASMSIDPLPEMPESWKAPADITIYLRPSFRPPTFILPSILDDEEEDQDKILTNPYGKN